MTEDEREELLCKLLFADMEAHDIGYERKTKQGNDNQNHSADVRTDQPVSALDGQVSTPHCG